MSKDKKKESNQKQELSEWQKRNQEYLKKKAEEEAALADRVLVMNQGEVVLDGSPKEIFQEEALLMSLKLDVPVATMLANRLRKD